MNFQDAKVGMKVRHRNWPKVVYGTITKLGVQGVDGSMSHFKLDVPFTPPEAAQSYKSEGFQTQLADFEPVE